MDPRVPATAPCVTRRRMYESRSDEEVGRQRKRMIEGERKRERIGVSIERCEKTFLHLRDN